MSEYDFITINLRYIWQALRQHANCTDGLGHAHAHVRWLYTFKAIICFVLRREGKNYEDYPVIIAWTDGGTGWSEYGTLYWGERLITGWGITRGWWYALEQVSSQ